MAIESPRAEDLRMDMGSMVGAVLSRWLRVLLVTALLVGVTYVILMFTPRLYESHSSILVEARTNAFNAPATAVSTGGAAVTIDALISSQIELIKSRDTLLKVIDAVNLRSVPEFNGSGPNPFNLVFQLVGRKPEQRSVDETVLQALNERMTVIRERDSAIISIFVRTQDPQLAADIANAVAAEHVKRRAEQTLEDTAEASTWLEQEIIKLRQRVADAETAVANYRAQNDLFEGPNNTSLVDQQLASLATQISEAQQRRSTAETRAALIRRMLEAGQPIDGLTDVQSSGVIQRLSQSKADLQGQFAQRSSTLLPNHPTMRALAAQIGEVERQIASEGRRVAASLEAEANIEAELAQAMQSEMTRLKSTAATAATSSVTLDELQREAKAQRDLLESYLLRYRDAVSRSDSASALPDVRIVSLAAPAVAPASPKTSFLLGAVAFGALALQVGGIMLGELMSGRAVVQRTTRVITGPGPGGEPMPRTVPPVDPDEPLLPFDGPASPQLNDNRSEKLSAEVALLAAAAAIESSGRPADPTATMHDEQVAETEQRISHEEADTPTGMVRNEVETEASPLVTPVPGDLDPPGIAAGAIVAEEPILGPVVVPVEEPAVEAIQTETLTVDEGLGRVVEERTVTRRRKSKSTIQPRASSRTGMTPQHADLATDPVTVTSPEQSDVTPEPALAVASSEAVGTAPEEVDAAAVPPKVDEAPAQPAEPPVEGKAEAVAGADMVAPAAATAAIEPAAEAAAAPLPTKAAAEEPSRYPSPLSNLAADLALGRVRVVMVAGLRSADDCLPMSDAIVAEALYAGLSVARVDAGTGDVSLEPGITDLAAGRASFGDVVHKGSHPGLSEIPWGQQQILDRRSGKLPTLVEALMDIYDVVVVLTGRVGMSSTLPLFAGIDCRLVLASVGRPNPDHVEAALADTSALGFQAHIMAVPVRQAAVA